MSEEHLNNERAQIMNIDVAEVNAPNIPIANYLLEAHATFVFLRENPDASKALIDVGMIIDATPLTSSKLLPIFEARFGAAHYAQALWDAVRSGRKTEELLALENEAYNVRSGLIAACEWNLRRDRIAMGTLEAIKEGRGLADLLTDLDALSVLILNHVSVFETDSRFDAEASAQAARDIAVSLRTRTSTEAVNTKRKDAVTLRNRAWTHLHAFVVEIRSAAHYVFRKDRETLKHFQSTYNRGRQKRRVVPIVEEG